MSIIAWWRRPETGDIDFYALNSRLMRQPSASKDNPIKPTSEKTTMTLTLLAAALMLLPLPVMQYVGEEGLYAIKAWEMHVRHDWWHPSILGNIWPHPPLFH